MIGEGSLMLLAIVFLIVGGIDCVRIESHRQQGTGPFKGCVCTPKESK